MKKKKKQKRNKKIIKTYKEGYSQHMIAKVLELKQATVQKIIKRTEAMIALTLPNTYSFYDLFHSAKRI